jgi:hypothetical protein
MDGMPDMDMPMDAPAVDVAVDDADPVKAAFITAMKGLIDQYDDGTLDDVAVLKKFKDVLKAHVKLIGKEMPAEVETETEVEVEPEVESLRLTNAKLTVEIAVPLSADHPRREAIERAAMSCPVFLSLHPEIEKDVHFSWNA